MELRKVVRTLRTLPAAGLSLSRRRIGHRHGVYVIVFDPRESPRARTDPAKQKSETNVNNNRPRSLSG